MHLNISTIFDVDWNIGSTVDTGHPRSGHPPTGHPPTGHPPTGHEGGPVKHCCSPRMLKLLLSVILFLVLIAYLVCGSHLFTYCEENFTIERGDETLYEQLRKKFTQKILASAQRETAGNVNISNTPNTNSANVKQIESAVDNTYLEESEIEDLMKKYKEEVINVYKSQPPRYEWDFVSSLLYCVSLITTIGYGNIVPLTPIGQFATIIYSIIGIPLTLFYLAMVGSILADGFSSLYLRVLKLFRRDKKTLDDIHAAVPLVIILLYLSCGAAMFASWHDNWTLGESAYFCFITLSTIGLGDYVFGGEVEQKDPAKMMGSVIYVIIGMSLFSMTFNLMLKHMIFYINWFLHKLSLFNRVDILNDWEKFSKAHRPMRFDGEECS
ncbi:potassium channel subfamily K member 18-like [Physella acuta]|uniref:potassium channel subfamily K member 18-like n=1 Tax=Physella acuta TaxID=109671 RepID=UPI0027DE2DBB|nr:potassium channel subfamily K member 18-like [Physella acuta]